MNAARPCMASAGQGPDPILEQVKVDGSVHGTFARIRMRQSYRNLSNSNVEIVYTFPLPIRSTLLDVVVELGGKRLRGAVFPKATAEGEYENAVADGNTAVMVEQPEPGLYVMNFGNLMAGEQTVVEVEFAILLDWHHNLLRLSLPMTLSPRYGEERSGLEPHQRPVTDHRVERAFSLDLHLSSEFAGAKIASPTHRITTQLDEGGIAVGLQRDEAWMDRDFVLTAEARAAPKPYACLVQDKQQPLLYGSFQIPPCNAIAPSRDVKIVLDCSGSMNGQSIASARAGVLKLLDKLRPEDRFGIVAFGTDSRSWKASMVGASEENLEEASAWVRERLADMGGTEMAAALKCAMKMRGASKGCDIFLITDGQIGETGAVIDFAQNADHRFFVVGVGTAPQQDLLAQLAAFTKGAVEWVTPNESIEDAIRRMFSRLTEVPVSALELASEGGFAWQVRTPSTAAFSGDTVHFFAGLRTANQAISAKWRFPDGSEGAAVLSGKRLPPELEDEAPRVAALYRIRDSEAAKNGAEAARLAIEYSLVTAHTNYLLVVDRGEARTSQMPKIRQVPHMLAAGWGGLAEVSVKMCLDIGSSEFEGTRMRSVYSACIAQDSRSVEHDLHQFIGNANRHYSSLLMPPRLDATLAALGSLGLPELVAEYLGTLAAAHDESDVVLAFWLAVLLHGPELGVARGLRRAIRKASGRGAADPALVAKIDAWLKRDPVGEMIRETMRG